MRIVDADKVINKIKKEIVSIESKEYSFSSGLENDTYYHCIGIIEDCLKETAEALNMVFVNDELFYDLMSKKIEYYEDEETGALLDNNNWVIDMCNDCYKEAAKIFRDCIIDLDY